MSFQPLGDRVLIRYLPDDKDNCTIIVPDAMKDQVKAVVLAVGDGIVQNGVKVPLSVNVGDVVLFETKNARDYSRVLNEANVYLVVERQIIGRFT